MKKVKFKQSEAQVKKAVCQYLEMRCHHWWPTNNVGIYDKNRGIYRTPAPGSKKGVPDVNLVYEGTYYAIELKSTTGKQSKEQRDFEWKTIQAGGVYLIVRSIDDLVKSGL